MSQQNNTGVVVLAAGKGTRLGCTDIPKVMLEIGGQPLVSYTVETLEKMNFFPGRICLVVGFKKEKVMEYFGDRVNYVVQEELLGTAHAAYLGMQALPKEVNQVLVMGGDDSAFYSPEALQNLFHEHEIKGAILTLLTAEIENPGQLGRIVRHADGSAEIIEKEYLTEEQKLIKEISTGTFVFNRQWFEKMFPTMPKLRKLGEFGLPTALAMARKENVPYQLVKLSNSREWFGVNTPEEKEEAERRKSL